MKKEDINPENDQVLYEIITVERKTDAGIILSTVEDGEYAPVIGRVIKSSSDDNKYKTGVKIMLSRGVSFKVPLGGFASKEAVYLVDKKYILATVN